jgi:hypothetical protein
LPVNDNTRELLSYSIWSLWTRVIRGVYISCCLLVSFYQLHHSRINICPTIFAMSASTTSAYAPYIGRWSGTSTTQPFNHFTIIDISGRDGNIYLCRHDRRSPKPLEGQINFIAADAFRATVPTWLGGEVAINGTFHDNSSSVVLVATIEGMA